jgi:hypothetical protein
VFGAAVGVPPVTSYVERRRRRRRWPHRPDGRGGRLLFVAAMFFAPLAG